MISVFRILIFMGGDSAASTTPAAIPNITNSVVVSKRFIRLLIYHAINAPRIASLHQLITFVYRMFRMYEMRNGVIVSLRDGVRLTTASRTAAFERNSKKSFCARIVAVQLPNLA